MTKTRQTDVESSLISRVRKLLDKAEGTSNSHEADAFSRKAAELIARHRIDESRLLSEADGELILRELLLGRGAYVRARLALLQACADNHDVRVVFQSTPTGTVALIAGFASDVELVQVMYTSLHQQAASQLAGIKRGTAAATQRFRRSFLFGYADRLHDMLADTRIEAERVAAPETQDAVTGRALALQARTDRIDEFAATSFGRVRTARAPSAAQVGGWSAGAEAAAGADVGRARLAGRAALGRGRSE